MVDRGVTRPTCTAGHLIWRVSDDHVELHVASKNLGQPRLDIVCVYERIGMGFELFLAVENSSRRAAELAVISDPRVIRALEPDVPIIAGEALRNGVFAGGVL